MRTVSQNILSKHSWAESDKVLWKSQILNLEVPGVGTGGSGNLPSLSIPCHRARFSPSLGTQGRSGEVQVSVALEKTHRSVALEGKSQKGDLDCFRKFCPLMFSEC